MPLPAAPCPPDPPAWVADQGARISPAGGCGSIVLESAPSSARFSRGVAWIEPALEARYTVRLVWRRLSDRPTSLELVFPGGSLLVRDGVIGWWESDARWAERGWTPAPAATARAQQITLTQDGDRLRAWIDGEELPPWRLAAPPGAGGLGVAVKGGPGDRARMWVDRVEVEPTDRRSRTPR